jgi:hypothetical protein
MSRSISPLSALWAIATLALLPESPCTEAQQPTTAAKKPAVTQPLDFVYYGGKITKREGRYVLQDSTMPIPFLLDDQQTAKKFEGDDVVVMGVIVESEPSHVTLHVQQIENVDK